MREIRTFRPDAVLCVDPEVIFYEDGGVNHTDHRAAGMAAVDAVYPAARNAMAFPWLARDGLEPWVVRRIYLFWSNVPTAWVDVTTTIDRKLDALRAHPSQLVFEITETAAMSEIDVTLAFIRQLKEMGCRFALDDFGAGFSSFYYLKRFEVDYLKIDGSFIRDLAIDEGSRIFVRALNDVARGLSKQVIAEWVETPEVLRILTDMGAQYGQGYLFQRPQPLERGVEPLRAHA